MKILVPIKRVPDPYATVRPTPDGLELDTSSIKFETNPFDEIAIEEAVRLREKHPGTEIITVTIGVAQAEDQLRKALAMGADRAILVETTEIYDSPSVAEELKSVALAEAPDLVLMGKQATDDDCNQVGQMLAAILNWPQATFASKIEINGQQIAVTRETDQGSELISMALPAVVTADLRLNEPRYIALPGIIKARSKPLDRKTPSTPSRPRTRVLKYEMPAPRKAGVKLNSVSDLVRMLKEGGVI